MAAWDRVDIDQIVDYAAEYKSVIEKAEIHGDNLVGLCPFHKDTNHSFSVDLKTGRWKCHAEDTGGNFITFWAQYHGISTTQEAYEQILDRYHVSREKPKASTSDPESYSLQQYSQDKKLPVDFLRDVCKTTTGTDRKTGITYLKIMYLSPNQEPIFRKRYAHKEFRWGYGSKGKIRLYGEWRIPEFQQDGYAVLVEGESDTQSLWYMGIPAIGVAGAVMFKSGQAALLQGLKLYIHKEPDRGGETFVNKVCRNLKDGGFTGKIYVWSCHQLGVKDPSDLFMEKGKEEAARLIHQLLDTTKPIDLDQMLTPEAIPGAPINLRQPDGWFYSEQGISAASKKADTPICICRTPIILTQRLKSIETGEEKIEIAFKRDGQWNKAIYPRSTIFSSRKITDLADLGCTITSENAKQVVRFLGALEAENIDLIPRHDATSTLGWQPGNRFLPGYADGITLDIDPSQRGLAAAYSQNGTLERWIQTMAPHRQRDRFRFILAASFAAPLLRIVKQRIFVVYNWGGSKGGKTAALKAALSVWGDPERLMVSFNATQVGLERIAAFYCDLPLGIDERQLAGNNQSALEQKVYMIANGTGRLRGAKTGGIQPLQQWRTIAIGTGEEPLSTETTQTGVSTRTLEIYGGPFDNETEASLMHQQAATDYGWAGPFFVKKLLELDESQIISIFESTQNYVRQISQGKNGAHIAGISVVTLADILIDMIFFNKGQWREAVERARAMAKNILLNQVESNATDVNENALQFIVDWILANQSQFGSNVVGTCFGFISENGNIVYILPSYLNEALKKAGFSSPRKIIKYLAEQKLITTYTETSGKKTYTVMRWFNNRSSRFIEFHLGKIAKSKDPIDDVEDAAEQGEQDFTEIPESEWEQTDFPF